MRVLEYHPLWEKAAHQINFVDNETQEQLNLLIKAVKDNQLASRLLEDFLDLMNLFPGFKFIIACAELHILHKKLLTYSNLLPDLIFDPFYNMTQNIWGELE